MQEGRERREGGEGEGRELEEGEERETGGQALRLRQQEGGLQQPAGHQRSGRELSAQREKRPVFCRPLRQCRIHAHHLHHALQRQLDALRRLRVAEITAAALRLKQPGEVSVHQMAPGLRVLLLRVEERRAQEREQTPHAKTRTRTRRSAHKRLQRRPQRRERGLQTGEARVPLRQTADLPPPLARHAELLDLPREGGKTRGQHGGQVQIARQKQVHNRG